MIAARVTQVQRQPPGLLIGGPLGQSLIRADDVHHGVDERQVRERLREVAKVTPAVRLDLLGVQQERARVGKQFLAQSAGAIHLADLRERGDEPERADRERPLLTSEPVVGRLHAVPEHEAVDRQLVGDGQHGCAHPLVGGRQEPQERDQEQRGVERIGVVVLHEDAAIVGAVLADVRMHLLGGAFPALGRFRVAAQAREPRPAIGRNPAEHLRRSEVLGLAADLPDSTVGFTPMLERSLDLAGEQWPEAVVEAITRARVEPDGVEQHAPDIVLCVVPGVVADADRAGAVVTGKVVERLLVELCAAIDAVHDLKFLVLDPIGYEVEVVARFPLAAQGGESPEHEGRVAQPAVAVVPVALTAGCLGQRGRRRGDHRPGRSVGQPLQRERGPLQVDLPGVIREATAACPLVPEGPRLGQPDLRLVIRRRRGVIAPAERAERGFARAHGGLRSRAMPLESHAQIGAKAQRRLDPLCLADGVPIRLSDVPPRSRAAAIVECGLAVDLDVDETVQAAEDAEQDVLGLTVARRADIPLRAVFVVTPRPDQQNVVHLEPAGGRAPRRLQDHRSRQVATTGRDGPVDRPDAKPPRVAVENRREDARPVHLRQRQPLDAPAGRDERADLAVGEQGVVRDRWKRTSAERNLTLRTFARRQLQLHAATVLQVRERKWIRDAATCPGFDRFRPGNRRRGSQMTVDTDQQTLDELCVITIRTLSMDAVQQANSGHPGTPMALAPIAYLLYTRVMRHSPERPDWPGRDRFVLSCGHASMLLYSTLYLAGYDVTLEQIKRFRQLDSPCAGHPEYGHVPGVETTTGPLGQGISTAVGMALGERMLAARFNRGDGFPIDHFTYFIASDGDMEEGIASEAASIAGHLGLGRLIGFYDDNHISIEGDTALAFSEDVGARYEAYGWHVQNLHEDLELDDLAAAIDAAQQSADRPSLIVVRTHIAPGSPHKQDTHGAHGSPLGEEEVRLTKEVYGYPSLEPFFVPDEAAELERCLARALPDGFGAEVPRKGPDAGMIATRKASQEVIQWAAAEVPEMVGGSADLAPSTLTLIDGGGSVEAGAYGGRNLHFGIREHGMGAIVNGLVLMGLRAYGAGFLIFSDYMKGAIRIAAIMRIPSTFVFTHDSIGVGEDGPTHQPIEQLATLRATPNLDVVRPAGFNETALAWRHALRQTDRPTALALSRQGLPVWDPSAVPDDAIERGAYVLHESDGGEAQLILMASGSEVHIANDARKLLEADGIRVRLVSMPCLDRFAEQDASYRDGVLPPAIRARVAVEAASPIGWHRWVGEAGDVVAMEGFGASAPAKVLYQHFGFTGEAVAERARAVLRAMP